MPGRGALTILIPSFNDWDALRLLLPRIDNALDSAGRQAAILVVDDASTDPLPEHWPSQMYSAIDSVEILHLRCNLGHQRAIALGLYHLHEFSESQAVIVMDGDGEDRAEDLPRMLEAFEGEDGDKVIFAARTKRMESVVFQFFYRLYQAVHRVLTGIEVRVGNFSVMPRRALSRLIASPDLWNHYAAAVYRARISKRLLPLPRGIRLTGTSKMNFVSLLMHGLAAISVFSDQVSARILAASAAFSCVAVGVVLTANISRLAAGWLIALMFQVLTFAILFAFLIARSRSSAGFILQRDAPYFILGKTTVRSAIPEHAGTR
jgi:glycosyltransferase involved in cell wall biosynthesis